MKKKIDRTDPAYWTELDSCGDAPYMDDLLHGQLKIYDVPAEHRTSGAYIYAMRWARDACAAFEGEFTAYTEKKVIEHFLLSDIIETGKAGDPRYSELHDLYFRYYGPCMNIYNAVGLI